MRTRWIAASAATAAMLMLAGPWPAFPATAAIDNGSMSGWRPPSASLEVDPRPFALPLEPAPIEASDLAPGPNLKCQAVPAVSDRCPTSAWVYDNPEGHGQYQGYDRLTGVRLSPNGKHLYAYGFSNYDATATDLAVVAFDTSSGDVEWVYHYDGGSAEAAYGLAVSADGSTIYVGGMGKLSTGRDELLAIALGASDGKPIWTTTYADPGNAVVTLGPGLSADGKRLYLGGTIWDDGTVPSKAIGLALEASTGEIDWISRWTPPDGELPNILALASAPDDTFYMTGYTRPASTFLVRSYLTVAFRDDRAGHRGIVQWSRQYDGGPHAGGINLAWDIAVARDGSTIAITGQGYRDSTNSVSDIETIAYDDDGTQLWVGRWGGGADGNNATGYAVAIAPDGERVFSSGMAPTVIDRNTVLGTVAYETDSGNQLWTSLPQSPGYYSLAHTVTTSRDGSTVYVSGDSGNANVRAAAVVALDAKTGSTIWTSRYNDGPAIDWDLPMSAVVAGDGKHLYVGAQAQRKNVGALSSVSASNAVDFLVLGYTLP